MLHAFDTHAPDRVTARAEWMALLSRAPLQLLEQALLPYEKSRRTEWLRRPETGLYMVQGRAGGTGTRFNLGEVTVTRCAMRSVDPQGDQSAVGVAYVLGREHRHAELAALADSLLQEPSHHNSLQETLLIPVQEHIALLRARRQAQVQSTKVDFFTVAREAGNGDTEEEDA